MQRERRLQVTVSPAMRVALEILAERSGLPVATQALATLRQALDRTIAGDECRRRLGAQRAFSSRDEWLLEQVDDRRAELARKQDAGTNGDEEA